MPVIQSGDQTLNNTIPHRFALALGGLLFTSIFALSASPVEAQCQQWNVGHGWRLKQGPTNVDLDLHQNATVITGTASFVMRVIKERDAIHLGRTFGSNQTVNGDVDGTVKGNHFAVIIHWDNNTTGVYNGEIGDSGRIEGTGYEQRSRSVKVNWHSDTHMECADTAPAKTTAPATPPKPAAPAVSPGWAGRWETRTAQGGHYEIIFVQNGDTVRGAFTDLNGNPKYNGSLSGDVSGTSLLYEYSQPEMQATGKGVFELGSSGRAITGTGVVNDAAKTKFKWWGWKTN